MPAAAYRTEDWADQLLLFLQTVVKRPSILVVQRALFLVAIVLAQLSEAHPWVRGVLSGPPAWSVITMLDDGAANPVSRYAVFSFLAGF